MNSYIIVGTESYPVDTDEERTEARVALHDAGLSEAPIWAGDSLDPDSYCTGAKFFALSVGDRVEAGKGDDHDTGRIDAIDGGTAMVAWDSGVKTTCPLSRLKLSP